MAQTRVVSDVIAEAARSQACRFGLDADEAINQAFAGLWGDRNVPAFVVGWIVDRVPRILANNARNHRRRRAKQPLLSDLVIEGEDDLERSDHIAAIDYRENSPVLNASDQEVVAHVSTLAHHPVEIRMLDYLFHRPDAPKSKQEIVAEANCSRGQAYRRVRLFEKRLEAAIKEHGTNDVR